MMPLNWARRIAARLRGAPARPAGLRGAGYDWERAAESALRDAGYEILRRNFSTRSGEIDLVAREGAVLCFVEVKGRSGSGFGLPAEAVTLEKRRRIFRAAQSYLAQTRKRPPVCRFDVVSILESEGGDRKVEILRDGFQGPTSRRRRR
jgi:putative endonuclease